MSTFVVGRIMVVVAILVVSACVGDVTVSDNDPASTTAPIVEVSEQSYERAIADTEACIRAKLPGADVTSTKLPTGYYQFDIGTTLSDFERVDAAYDRCRALFLDAVESAYAPDPSIYQAPDEHFLEVISECLRSVGVDPSEIEDIPDAIHAATGTDCAVD